MNTWTHTAPQKPWQNHGWFIGCIYRDNYPMLLIPEPEAGEEGAQLAMIARIVAALNADEGRLMREIEAINRYAVAPIEEGVRSELAFGEYLDPRD